MSHGPVILLFLYACAAAADQAGSDDAYLSGYLSALLERQLLWTPDSFRVETHDGVATVILYTDQPGRARAAENALAGVRVCMPCRCGYNPAVAVATCPTR